MSESKKAVEKKTKTKNTNGPRITVVDPDLMCKPTWDGIVERAEDKNKQLKIKAPSRCDIMKTVLDQYVTYEATIGSEDKQDADAMGELQSTIALKAKKLGVSVGSLIGLLLNPPTITKAGEKITVEVEKVMAANMSAQNDHDMIQLSHQYILKTLGTNGNTIRQWLKDHADMVASHHEMLSIGTDHNRLSGMKKKQLREE